MRWNRPVIEHYTHILTHLSLSIAYSCHAGGVWWCAWVLGRKCMCFLLVASDWSYTRLNRTGSVCAHVCVRAPPLRSRGFVLLYYNPKIQEQTLISLYAEWSRSACTCTRSHTYAREHKLQTALVHWESKSLSLSQLYFSFWLRSHTEDARGSFVCLGEKEKETMEWYRAMYCGMLSISTKKGNSQFGKPATWEKIYFQWCYKIIWHSFQRSQIHWFPSHLWPIFHKCFFYI